MGAAAIEESNIFTDEPSGMAHAEDQDMVKAFTANRAEETFTQRIGFGSAVGRVEQFDVNASNRAFKQHAIFVIVIANQEAGTGTERRRLTDLLSHPSITRRRVAAK